MLIKFSHIYHIIVLFGFLFEIPLMGPLTTRRISLLLALISLLINYKATREVTNLFKTKFLRKSLFFYTISFFIAFFNIFLLPEGNYDASYFEPWYILYIILYVVLFSIYTVQEFKEIKYFGYILFSCFFIQAIIVYTAVLYAPVRLVVLHLFNSGFEDQYASVVENGSRIMGIGLAFSTGSIICSILGVFLTYMVIKNQLSFVRFLFFYAILASLTVFIGRTGVAVELLCLFFILIKRPHFFFKYSIVLVLVLLGLVHVISNTLLNSDIANGDMFIEWMTALFSKEGRGKTLEGIHQTMPVFSYRFIMGTGVMQGQLPQGDYMYSDCGYVMIYSALGIIGAITYYLANLNLYRSVLRNVRDRLPRLFIIFLILIAFVIEYKEPFMQKYVFSYIILTIGLFQLKSQNIILR